MKQNQQTTPNTKFVLSIGEKTKLIPADFKGQELCNEKTLSVCTNPKSSVFVLFDREDENATNSEDISPDIICLRNLTGRGIHYIAANPGSINIVTESREFLTASTVITEEKNEEVTFNTPSIFDLYDIINVSCGAEHTIVCGMQQNTSFIFCRGNNSHGQLGLGHTFSYTERFKQVHIENSPQFFQVACGSFFTLLLTTTAKVWGFGHNHHGQLGVESREEIVWTPTEVDSLNGLPISYISAGTSHSLALTTTGLLFCAGSNSQGQLGISSQSDQSSFTLVESLSGVFVVYASASGCYSSAIDEFGTLYIWGGAWGSSPRSVTVDGGDRKEIFADVSLGADGRFSALTSLHKLIVGGFYVNGEQVLTPIEIESPQVPFTRVFSGGEYFIASSSSKNKLPLQSIYFDTCKALLPPKPVEPLETRDRLRPPHRILSLFSMDFDEIQSNPFFSEAAISVFTFIPKRLLPRRQLQRVDVNDLIRNRHRRRRQFLLVSSPQKSAADDPSDSGLQPDTRRRPRPSSSSKTSVHDAFPCPRSSPPVTDRGARELRLLAEPRRHDRQHEKFAGPGAVAVDGQSRLSSSNPELSEGLHQRREH